MIQMKQPSLVLHSCDVPGYKYRMWKSWVMPEGASGGNVVSWINMAVSGAADMYIHNVIINCHGGPGALYIGGGSKNPLRVGGLGVFTSLRQSGSVGTIWLVACEVASDSGDCGGSGFGTLFCSEMAKSAGTDVVGADALQSVDSDFENNNHPYGAIDDYEGTVYRFSAGGSWGPWTPGADF